MTTFSVTTRSQHEAEQTARGTGDQVNADAITAETTRAETAEQANSDALDSHEAATTSVHGIADSAALVVASDPPSRIGAAPVRALWVPGINGNGILAPNPSWTPTDLDVRLRFAADDWDAGTTRYVFALGSPTTTATFAVLVSTTGPTSCFSTFSGDGWGNMGGVNMKELGSPADGESVTVRWIYDSSTGESGGYTSHDGGHTWDQHNVTTHTGTPFHNTADPISIGGHGADVLTALRGSVAWAEVRDGIDGPIVARYDARGGVATRYRDVAGNIWSPVGDAWAETDGA